MEASKASHSCRGRCSCELSELLRSVLFDHPELWRLFVWAAAVNSAAAQFHELSGIPFTEWEDGLRDLVTILQFFSEGRKF